ncbi:MAG: hypothetical protein HZA04_10855, partial [Nitrospinae bacterium]|nr:hypothetical protein [Nitrospinota bacterium]
METDKFPLTFRFSFGINIIVMLKMLGDKKTIRLMLMGVATLLLFLHSPTFADECLKYEPEVVTLTGTLHKEIFPGFPNYSSIKKGDHADKVFILRLDQAICVVVEPPDESNESAEDVLDIQLDGIRHQVPNWPKVNEQLKSTKVVVRGSLYHQQWGFEHTKVLMAVESISFIA